MALAEASLATQRAIEEAKTHVAIVRGGEYASMRNQFDELYGRQQALVDKVGPEVIMRRFKEELQQVRGCGVGGMEHYGVFASILAQASCRCLHLSDAFTGYLATSPHTPQSALTRPAPLESALQLLEQYASAYPFHLPLTTPFPPRCPTWFPRVSRIALCLLSLQSEDRADELLEQFQAGGVPLEGFVEQYVAARDNYHTVDLKRQAIEHHIMWRNGVQG